MACRVCVTSLLLADYRPRRQVEHDPARRQTGAGGLWGYGSVGAVTRGTKKSIRHEEMQTKPTMPARWEIHNVGQRLPGAGRVEVLSGEFDASTVSDRVAEIVFGNLPERVFLRDPSQQPS